MPACGPGIVPEHDHLTIMGCQVLAMARVGTRIAIAAPNQGPLDSWTSRMKFTMMKRNQMAEAPKPPPSMERVDL
jgi:hypothetical protein